MKLTITSIEGLYIADTEKKQDDRGYFARTWDASIAKRSGLIEKFDYTCISGNKERGTLRGMHYQKAPHGESKLVRCTKGKIFDVAIDLRPDSKTFKKWVSCELSDKNHTALYIPAGCAHGFITLTDDTEVLYMIAGAFNDGASAGVRWDDPAFAIAWPMKPSVIADRDATFADFSS